MESGEIIATHSSGIKAEKNPKATVKAVKPRIAELRSELDLDAIAKSREQAYAADRVNDERLASMSVHDFVDWFWSDNSYYITKRKDAGRPPSREYVETSRSYVRTTIKSIAEFRLTSLRDIHLSIIEAFVRKLRRAGKSRDVIKRNIGAIRTPIN
jgi:hypothetical protein